MNFRFKKEKEKGETSTQVPSTPLRTIESASLASILRSPFSVLRSPSPPSSSSHFTIHISLGFQFHSSPSSATPSIPGITHPFRCVSFQFPVPLLFPDLNSLFLPVFSFSIHFFFLWRLDHFCHFLGCLLRVGFSHYSSHCVVFHVSSLF